MSPTTKAAWIGFAGVLLAAVIGGTILLVGNTDSGTEDGPVRDQGQASTIQFSTDANAARDVIVNNVTHNYLLDHYQMAGIIGEGWLMYPLPSGLLDNLHNDLNILPRGFLEDRLMFILASGPETHCRVERLYLELTAYCPTLRRDAGWLMMGASPSTSLTFYVSEDYDIYPIYPVDEMLRASSWVYRGRDSDEFAISLTCEPFVLYLLTINADYIDLRTGQRKRVKTDEFALIRLVEGNVSSCDNVARWFTDDMRLLPRHRRYDENIPPDIYQLLCADIANDPGLLNVFLGNEHLVGRRQLVSTIVTNRPDNTVFARNLREWEQGIEEKIGD